MSERTDRGSAAGQRNALLDLWRSLSVCAMVAYHLQWDLSLFGKGPLPPVWAAYLIGGSFILISGASAGYSRSCIRRGFFIFCAGLAVTIVSAAVKLPVKFGILQLLGVSMIAWGLLEKKTEAVPVSVRIPLWLLLFAGAWALTDAVTVRCPFLYPLGLKTADFYSADYYPLLPWFFLFLTGTGLGESLRRFRKSGICIPRFLCIPGRHSLGIYLLHQPLLFGLCWVLFR